MSIQTCQKFHWFVHKKYCAKKKKEMEARDAHNKKLEEKQKTDPNSN